MGVLDIIAYADADTWRGHLREQDVNFYQLGARLYSLDYLLPATWREPAYR